VKPVSASRAVCLRAGIWLCALALHFSAGAAVHTAGPDDYLDYLKRLEPGDTLRLDDGIYHQRLLLRNLQGAPGREIIIEGPERGEAVFIAQDDTITISLIDVAHVTIRRLRLEGGGARAHAVVAEGRGRFAHHVTLEELRISGYDAAQGYVGISTKVPAWNWIIRRNHISDTGTGMYLGNSDGNAPFVAGLIEGNVIERTLGYNLQIKHQLPRPALAGMPRSPAATVIRDNVFSKRERGSAGDRARPNVLLGHWPLHGQGSEDRYLVYRNLFLHNPHERLLQAEGNVALYNNMFVNAFGDGVSLQAHNDVPRHVDVRRNVIAVYGTGLRLSDADPAYRQRVTANIVYAGRPMAVSDALRGDNIERAFDEVSMLIQRTDGRQLVPALLAHLPPWPTDGADAADCAALPELARGIDGRWQAVSACGADHDNARR
jgi:hypothetical protein